MGTDKAVGVGLMSADPVFFVFCGTPRDRGGFESATLGGRQLPADVASQVDKSSQEAEFGPDRPAYLCGRIETGHSGSFAAFYAEYRWIQPSDAPNNRGAYIAVGFCAAAPLDPVQAEAAFWRIESAHRDLTARRGGGHSFPQDFRLRDYAVSLPAAPGGWLPESWPRKSELQQCGILTATAPESGHDFAFMADRDHRWPAAAELAVNPPGPPAAPVPQAAAHPAMRLQCGSSGRWELRPWWNRLNDLEMVVAGAGLIVWGALAIGLFLAAQALIG